MAGSTHHFLLSSPSLNLASTHVVSIKLSLLNFLSQAKVSSSKRMPKVENIALSDAFPELCKFEISFSVGEESTFRRARGPKSTQSVLAGIWMKAAAPLLRR
nr:hypothetical protein Iba_chr05dCG11600 [Ipomoea batatas]